MDERNNKEGEKGLNVRRNVRWRVARDATGNIVESHVRHTVVNVLCLIGLVLVLQRCDASFGVEVSLRVGRGVEESSLLFDIDNASVPDSTDVKPIE